MVYTESQLVDERKNRDQLNKVTEKDRVEVIPGEKPTERMDLEPQGQQITGVADSSAHSQKGPLTCIQKISEASRTSTKVALIHGYPFLWHTRLSIKMTNEPTDSTL